GLEDGELKPEDGNLRPGDGAMKAEDGGLEPENGGFKPEEQASAFTSTRLPRRMGLYDYLYGTGYLVPRIHTRLLAENLRHARRVGFTDYYAETYPNWALHGPMLWLTAQLLQDPEQSPEVLLDEYYRRYFRTAAVPMRRFFELCERQWMTQPGSAYW